MSPLMQRALDVAIATALTAGVVFVVIAINSFLMSRGGSWAGFRLWYAYISRPDILGTMILTALVTIAYGMWHQSRRPGR
jgi:ABC-type multidrug transport system permease subunit